MRHLIKSHLNTIILINLDRDKMCKYIVLILLLVSGCSRSENEKSTQIDFSVSFDKIYETAEYTDNEDSWVVRPRDLTVDNDGNVYVSDQERNIIQKFDSDLNFIKKIGREGRGPGEFDRVTSVFADSVLLGFSEGSSTINKFSLDGEFITSYNIDNIRGNPDIFRFNDGFILSSMPFSGDLSQYYGIHIYNKAFEKKGLPQLQAKEIYPDFNQDLSYQVMTGYGNIQFIDEYSFMIAPRIYSGTLYKFVYDSESNEWNKVSSIEAAEIENNYSKLPGRESAEMLFFPPGQDEPLAFRIHGESLFLSQLSSGRFAHFIKRDVGKARQYGVELFDDQFTYLGFEVLASDPDSYDDERVRFYAPKANNSKDVFYSIEFDENGPKLVARKLEVHFN